MAKREKPEVIPPKGAPGWIVTFTDMSSLLLTFFILILTFSSTEKEKLKKAEGSLTGAFGVVEDLRRSKRDVNANVAVNNAEQDPNGVPDEYMRRDQVDDLEDLVQKRDVFNVQFDNSAEGTRVRLMPSNGDEIFGLLDEELTAEAEALLKEAAGLFRSLPYRIVVETHVDNRTWRVKRGMTAMRWTLARALAAAEVLESVGIPPERISVSPKGDFEPLAPNKNGPKARYKNRRLEILFIPNQSDPLYRKYSTEGDSDG
ncbi:MAG: flagellar motor protein MotB [Planctomycetota bacterium]